MSSQGQTQSDPKTDSDNISTTATVGHDDPNPLPAGAAPLPRPGDDVMKVYESNVTHRREGTYGVEFGKERED
ncbi:hypothetical protein ACHAP5_011464 [Fusarium lateritium]